MKTYNVKLGLINPAVLINPLCPKKKCNLKKGGPPGLINPPNKKTTSAETHFLSNNFYFQFYLFPTIFVIIVVILKV